MLGSFWKSSASFLGKKLSLRGQLNWSQPGNSANRMDRDCICQKESEEPQNNPRTAHSSPCSSRQHPSDTPMAPGRQYLPWVRVFHVGLHTVSNAALQHLLHTGHQEDLSVRVGDREHPLQERQQLSPSCVHWPSHCPYPHPTHPALGMGHRGSPGKLSLVLCLALPVSPARQLWHRPKPKRKAGFWSPHSDNNTLPSHWKASAVTQNEEKGR